MRLAVTRVGTDTMHGQRPTTLGGGPVVSKLLRDIGLRSIHFHAASLAAIGLCIGLWTRAQSMEHDERSNAERRAVFVGLWPPTLWIIGDSLDERG